MEEDLRVCDPDTLPVVFEVERDDPADDCFGSLFDFWFAIIKRLRVKKKFC